MLTALYIHIPFCNQICSYCDFVKEVASLEKKNDYIEALKVELSNVDDDFTNLKTVYIGGGTPSSLSNELLEDLLEFLNNKIDINRLVEFSIETNPNDLTLEKCKIFTKYGINRVSVGVQTFHKHHLSFLNRSHDDKDVYTAITNLRQAGIKNINIDMIFSLVNQTIEELYYDIKKVKELDIEHVSYYSLILEDKTRLMHLYNKGEISINDEDKEALMYNIVLDELVKQGFEHYEISNFCKNKQYSHHNLVYWTNKDYLGLGAGAHSLFNEHRFYNISSVKKYIEAINQSSQYQTSYIRKRLEEEIIMGLRLLKGINHVKISKEYNINMFEKYDKLHKFIEDDLLQLDGDYIKFTRKGLFLGNIIFGHFLEE